MLNVILWIFEWEIIISNFLKDIHEILVYPFDSMLDVEYLVLTFYVAMATYKENMDIKPNQHI